MKTADATGLQKCLYGRKFDISYWYLQAVSGSQGLTQRAHVNAMPASGMVLHSIRASRNCLGGFGLGFPSGKPKGHLSWVLEKHDFGGGRS